MMLSRRLLQAALLILISVLVLSGCIGVIVDYASVPYLTIDRVEIIENVPYVRGIEGHSYGMGMHEEEEPWWYFLSHDAGKTWQRIENLPDEAAQAFQQPGTNPKFSCYSTEANICFRIIDGKDQVQSSKDGGAHWKVDWRMPLGRRGYMERSPALPYGLIPDTMPYDLAILEGGQGAVVIAAMGNQGVLIRDDEGVWQRLAVSSELPRAAPIPYRATAWSELTYSLIEELKIVVFLFPVYFLALTISGWVWIHSFLGRAFRYKALFSYVPFLGLSALCIWLLSLSARDYVEFWISIKGKWTDYTSGLVYALPFIGMALTWLILILFSRNRAKGFGASVVPLGSVLILSIGWLFPFVLWAFGIIPVYWLALTLALLFGALIVFYSFRLQRLLAREAAVVVGYENPSL